MVVLQLKLGVFYEGPIKPKAAYQITFWPGLIQLIFYQLVMIGTNKNRFRHGGRWIKSSTI
jgi:hypothetical protein